MVSYTFKINNTDYSQFVERDSYVTELTPVFGETIKTMDGVNHTALLRLPPRSTPTIIISRPSPLPMVMTRKVTSHPIIPISLTTKSCRAISDG